MILFCHLTSGPRCAASRPSLPGPNGWSPTWRQPGPDWSDAAGLDRDRAGPGQPGRTSPGTGWLTRIPHRQRKQWGRDRPVVFVRTETGSRPTP